MILRDLAHSRTGDKGDISNISLICIREEDYPMLVRLVTAARVKAWFSDIVRGEVTRYELPGLHALNFVMTRALGGGVTRSLAVDMHGKTLSSALLAMPLPEEDEAGEGSLCVGGGMGVSTIVGRI